MTRELDLGRHYGARGALPTRPREEAEHARELLRQLDAAFDVTVPVGAPTPAERRSWRSRPPSTGGSAPRAC